jgi:hypothetical protein
MAKLFNSVRLFYLSYFAKPAGDRLIYRAIVRGRAKRVLEIGIGSAVRACRMIETMRRTSDGDGVSYCGIDQFELSRGHNSATLSLKAAHCKLQRTGARVRLVPGDPFSALAAMANTIGACDVIVIAAGHDVDSLGRAWFYVPRLLHSTTQVFAEPTGDGKTPIFESLSHDEIRRRAHAGIPRRTAA